MNRKVKSAKPCGEDPDFWFPEGSVGQGALRQMKAAADICNSRCAVREACLEVAMAAEGWATADKRFGVYGGLTPAERAALVQRRSRAAQRAASRELAA